MQIRLYLFLCLILCVGSPMAQSRISITYSDTLQPLFHQLPDTVSVGDEKAAALKAEKILTILEQHGYPFAEVRMKEKKTDTGITSCSDCDKTGKKRSSSNIMPDSLKMDIQLQVIANHYIVWDSIVVKGDAKISPKFLAPYLKIRKGKAYDEQLVQQSEKALKALDYVTILQPPKPSFTKDAAALYLYLNKKNANSFDGFVGFTSKENGQGIQLYGQANLKIQNIFGHGEGFTACWNRLQTNYQTLTLEINYPCLFQTPFCLFGQFDMLRNDTNYYRISLPTGLRYLIKGNNYLQIQYRFETGNQTGGTGSMAQKNYKIHNYGIGLYFRNIDDMQIPHKGYSWESSVETGKKLITDSSKTFSTWSGKCTGSLYLPFGKHWVQANRLLAGFISDPQLFESNLFLMGGLHSMRGVNEQSLSASAYCFVSEEIRFLLNDQFFFQLFVDGGWYERKLTGSYHKDTPIGIGAGFSLLTQAGLLSMSYALAAHDNQGFKFKSAKISIGFNAFF